MKKSDLERLIVDLVNSPDYSAVKPRVIAKQLRLSDDDTREVRKAVKRLVKKGQLSYGSNHLVESAARRPPNQIVGAFHRAQGGFGFVRRLTTEKSAGKQEDIFIPEEHTGNAANGDIVAIRVTRSRRHGQQRSAGEIIDVLERRMHEFVGTYNVVEDVGLVSVDGKGFSQPILVGDAGAKGAEPGDKVVIEMVKFPSPKTDGEAVITEVLGKYGQPGVDTMVVIREFALPDEFPEDVLEDARQQAEQFDESVGDGRVDLTELTVITIDPKDARDFDDAISLERLDNGHWRLGVHIADVAHFVRPKTALDREAKNRATSIYLPDRVIPMLPETISNNLASLQPDRVRYSQTAFIEFTGDGARVATDTVAGAIRSRHRFNYEEVDEYLADRKLWKDKLEPDVFRLVGEMHELAMILRRRRMTRGSLELTMPEVKLDLDREGNVAGARKVVHTESHQVIEEFMLAANEAVAESLQDQQLLFLRRVHGNPDPRKLKALTQFIRHLGIESESLESRFEIQRVLQQVEGCPEQYAVNYAILRSMQKAVYAPDEEGHYALASDCYCHFTSPIRRYPDLTVHRMLQSLFEGKRPANDRGWLTQMGEHCSDREQRAESAERELIKLKLLRHFSEKIGCQMPVVITGVEKYGMFVEGLELPGEGLIRIDTLEDDSYDYDDSTHSLVGRRADNVFQLGDRLTAEVAAVDLDRRELDFHFVSREQTPTPSRKRKPAGGSDRTNDKKGQGKEKGKSKGKKSIPQSGAKGKKRRR